MTIKATDLLYGKDGTIVYGSQGVPLYADMEDILSAARLVTYWDFRQIELSEKYGSGHWPDAFINDVLVCKSHVTEHIIDYSIATDDFPPWDSQENAYVFDFTMGFKVPSETTYFPPDEDIYVGFYCWPAPDTPSWQGGDVNQYRSLAAGESGWPGATASFRLYYNPNGATKADQYRIVPMGCR